MTQEHAKSALQSLRAMKKEEFTEVEAFDAIQAVEPPLPSVISIIREFKVKRVIVQCRPDQGLYRIAVDPRGPN